jgi:hypothetical protein
LAIERASSTSSGAGEERGHHRHELTHSKVAQHAAGLQHHGDPAGADGVLGRPAEDRDRTLVRRLKAEQHVDCGGLARTVRA